MPQTRAAGGTQPATTASTSTRPLMKPLAALAIPGMYLVYKYNQLKRQHEENQRRKVTEKELNQLNHKIDKLLAKLDEHETEYHRPIAAEEECVVCLCAKATMQTYPCGHKVVCRKCFVKTIQVAVTQRCLPLRCVVCRTRILKLKQSVPPAPQLLPQQQQCQSPSVARQGQSVSRQPQAVARQQTSGHRSAGLSASRQQHNMRQPLSISRQAQLNARDRPRSPHVHSHTKETNLTGLRLLSPRPGSRPRQMPPFTTSSTAQKSRQCVRP